MVVSSPCRVLIFQEISYHYVPCRIVSHVVPVSVLHRLGYGVLIQITLSGLQ